MNLEQRFWNKVNKNKPDKCWNWIGYVNKRGYGEFHWSKKKNTLPAHRASLLIHGIKLDPNLTVDHKCFNRLCCNPDHLEQVTMKENLARGNGITARHARKTHCIHGHEFTTENTYIHKIGTRRCRICIRKNWMNSYRKRQP